VTGLAPADALAILQLAGQADTRATQRDAAGYAALFSEDAVMDGDMGRVARREALAASVARVWAGEPPGTLHLTCNAVLDDSAPTPTVASVLLMVIPQSPGVAIQAADVVQRFLHTPAGWKISSRQITITLAARPVAGHEGGRHDA
jgi:hypothetical protein